MNNKTCETCDGQAIPQDCSPLTYCEKTGEEKKATDPNCNSWEPLEPWITNRIEALSAPNLSPHHKTCKFCQHFREYGFDDYLDLALEVQARTLDRLEAEIFETEKNALTDWFGRLKTLHERHFEAAAKYDQIMARMQELHNHQTPSHVSDGLPF